MKNDEILRSWKEISAYLKCDRRTCLRWEKNLGLPIHRKEGSEKGGVFALRSELDAWLVQRSGPLEPALSQVERIEAGRIWARFDSRRWSGRRLIVFHIFALSILAAVIVLLARPVRPRVPVNFRIEGSELAALGGGGRELFRYETGAKNLVQEERYRDHFQTKSLGEGNAWQLPWLAFSDIDLDGRRETLFCLQTEDESNEGEIFCLDTQGKKRWGFKSGRELKFGGQVYSSDYRISGFSLNDVDSDGKPEILLFSNHKPDWPCQFVILAPEDGRVLGEYWNSGYLGDFAVADLNGDGRNEIVVCGVNNEYGQGIVAVFDADDVQGSSPQINPKFSSDDLRPGSEKFYIRLPRTDADAGLHPIEAANTVFISHARELSFRTDLSGLYFEFDFSLDLLRVRNTHQFILLHQAAVEAGRATSVLDDGYLKALGAGVLYWDGEAKSWTSHKAHSNKW